MFTSLFINIFFIFIMFTFINLLIKCYNIYVNRRDNFIVGHSVQRIKDCNKITHYLYFNNFNRFYFYNTNIFNFIIKKVNKYLKNYYNPNIYRGNNIKLIILVFEYNNTNNTYSLISDINEIQFNHNYKDNLTSIKINKFIIRGNRNILVVIKEI